MKIIVQPLTPMKDEAKRQAYEDNAIEVVKDVYTHINPNVTFTVPTDPYSHYDMVATTNDKVYYVENKTRNISYKVYKDEGYYLDANKVDGTINIFNYYFPQDSILMITKFDKIKDLMPQNTFVKKAVYVDDESQSTVQQNIIIPYNRFWVYDTENYNLINKPIKLEI